jgi:hypothetical protein
MLLQELKVQIQVIWYHTFSPGPSRPARAKSKVVFPELGGPKSSVILHSKNRTSSLSELLFSEEFSQSLVDAPESPG